MRGCANPKPCAGSERPSACASLLEVPLARMPFSLSQGWRVQAAALEADGEGAIEAPGSAASDGEQALPVRRASG